MLSTFGPNVQAGVLGHFQAWFNPVEDSCAILPCTRALRAPSSRSPKPIIDSAPWSQASEASFSSSNHGQMEARKKELQDELQRDLERLAAERKEGLHRIDWQLAAAVEDLHAETVQKANDLTARHQQMLAEMERQTAGSAYQSPAGSARSRASSAGAESTTAQSEQATGRSSGGASGHGSTSSRASSDDEDEAPGVWNHVVGFIQKVQKVGGDSIGNSAGNLFAGGSSAGGLSLGLSSLGGLAGSLGLPSGALGGSPAVRGAGTEAPRSMQEVEKAQSAGGSSRSSSSRTSPPPQMVPFCEDDQGYPEKLGARGDLPTSPAHGEMPSRRLSYQTHATGLIPPRLPPRGPGEPPGTPSQGTTRPGSRSSDSWRSNHSYAPPPPPPAPSPFPEDLPSTPSRNNWAGAHRDMLGGSQRGSPVSSVPSWPAVVVLRSQAARKKEQGQASFLDTQTEAVLLQSRGMFDP
ncbi:unnamed protein product, partial [Polarella glacialis]